MGTLQKTFDLCKALYEVCYNDVKKIAKEAAVITASDDEIDIDPKAITGKFDIVLQYSLLQIAISDYDFDKNEMIFIRDLTRQGDFLDFFNSFCDANITWNEFCNSDIKDVRKIINLIEDAMIKLCNEFVAIIAAYDCVHTERNIVGEFEEEIVAIILGLASMDGDVTAEEVKQNCVILKAINSMKALKKL